MKYYSLIFCLLILSGCYNSGGQAPEIPNLYPIGLSENQSVSVTYGELAQLFQHGLLILKQGKSYRYYNKDEDALLVLLLNTSKFKNHEFNEQLDRLASEIKLGFYQKTLGEKYWNSVATVQEASEISRTKIKQLGCRQCQYVIDLDLFLGASNHKRSIFKITTN